MTFRSRAIAALLIGAGALALASCEGRPRSGTISSSSSSTRGFFAAAAGKIVAIDLSDGVPESTGGGFFPLPASRTYVGLVRALDRAKHDQDAKGVYVRLGTEPLGFAQAEELGRLLGAIRDKGKPIVCHADSITNATAWLLARGCERIWLSPAGDADTVGIAAQLVHVKGALDKLEVAADFVHVGKYKSFSEPLERESPSEESRQALLFTIKSFRKNWLDGTTAARKQPDLRQALERGPWSAKEAKARGLVDEIGYETQAHDDIKKRAGVERLASAFGRKTDSDSPPDFTEIIRALTGADERAGGRPHVAVVVAEGSISMRGGGLLDGGGGITAKSMKRTLKKLAKNDSVKAVVLRIDSPGGSALASDLLWHELRELGKKKPLVASVGGMAASGGYYLASAAKTIIAERTSIVGSIGVVGGKIVIGDALEKYGVNTFTLPASDEPGADHRAAYSSPLIAWDSPTRDRVRKAMIDIYDLFLDRVSQGRGVPVEKIKPFAEGRIWSGEHGKERGLVDQLGGLADAIQLARELGELDDRAPVVVEGGAESLFETLLLGSDASDAELSAAVARLQARQSPIARALPPELRAFVGAYSALTEGETTTLALPYALFVR
jgi:protease IV